MEGQVELNYEEIANGGHDEEDKEEAPEMVDRRCMKPECDKVFKVMSNSETRFCSSQHGPVVAGGWLKGKKKLTPEQMAKVKEVVTSLRLQGYGASEIAKHLNEAGLKTAYGSDYLPTHVYGFIARWGLSEKGGPKRKLEEAADQDAEEFRRERLGPSPAERLPKLAMAILEDETLNAMEQLSMLRRYAGLD